MNKVFTYYFMALYALVLLIRTRRLDKAVKKSIAKYGCISDKLNRKIDRLYKFADRYHTMSDKVRAMN